MTRAAIVKKKTIGDELEIEQSPPSSLNFGVFKILFSLTFAGFWYCFLDDGLELLAIQEESDDRKS